MHSMPFRFGERRERSCMTENKEGEEKEGRLFVLWILGESSV
jgi:hypothetical protein